MTSAPGAERARSRRRQGPYTAPRGYSAVPEIDVRATAGPGAWNDEPEETRDPWLFADPFIRHEFRAKPDDLRMITLDGDSKEPLLLSGDRILIDVSRQSSCSAGHLRDLGRHGTRRQADRACASFRSAQGGAQVPQPRVRQQRATRRGSPPRRPCGVGLPAAVRDKDRHRQQVTGRIWLCPPSQPPTKVRVAVDLARSGQTTRTLPRRDAPVSSANACEECQIRCRPLTRPDQPT